MFKKKILSILLILICFSLVYPQKKKYYYYKPENNFGSDLLFNHATLLINGGFDIFRNGGHSKNIFDQYYADGFNNVFANISNPFPSIRAYGWDRFMAEEFFNFQLNKNNSNFIPNIVDHTLGNGMEYAKLAEWFDYHQYPVPKLFAFLVTTTYQFTNEVVENGRYKGPNIDTIADVWVFNTLGFVLFEFDFVKEFFSETLPMYSWDLQPMFNLKNNYLENAGQQYLIRKELPFVENLSGFVYWGLSGIAGFSYKYDEIHSISIGVGQVANRINENITNGLRFFSPDLDGALTIFYDKNNSLLFSALITGPRIPNIRINVYPGLFSIGDFSPGIFIGAGKWDNFIIGVNFTHYMPFSFAYGNER